MFAARLGIVAYTKFIDNKERWAVIRQYVIKSALLLSLFLGGQFAFASYCPFNCEFQYTYSNGDSRCDCKIGTALAKSNANYSCRMSIYGQDPTEYQGGLICHPPEIIFFCMSKPGILGAWQDSGAGFECQDHY